MPHPPRPCLHCRGPCPCLSPPFPDMSCLLGRWAFWRQSLNHKLWIWLWKHLAPQQAHGRGWGNRLGKERGLLLLEPLKPLWAVGGGQLGARPGEDSMLEISHLSAWPGFSGSLWAHEIDLFTSAWRTRFGVYFSASLLVLDSPASCLSGNNLILPTFLEDFFTGYRILICLFLLLLF